MSAFTTNCGFGREFGQSFRALRDTSNFRRPPFNLQVAKIRLANPLRASRQGLQYEFACKKAPNFSGNTYSGMLYRRLKGAS